MKGWRQVALAAASMALISFSFAHSATADTPLPPGYDPHDFSGLWMNDKTLDEELRAQGRHRMTAAEAALEPPVAHLPLTPAYQAKFEQMQADAAKLAVGASACTWEGIPEIMGYPYPFEFLLTPGRITAIFEADSQVRRIWLDRDKHLDPDDLNPSYYGDSIGHWEGDTLVVDTIGFNTETTIHGAPHSDKMHVVERWRHVTTNSIEDVLTITDADALTAPVVYTYHYSRRPGWRIEEYSCEENNRDVPDASGARAGGVVPQGGK